MEPCHSLKLLWHSLCCKVLLLHRSPHFKRTCLAMESASSNLKQRKDLLMIASEPSCARKARPTHGGLLFVNHNRYCHLHGYCRYLHTEALRCVPHDHECSHMEPSARVSDGHVCSPSFENGDALRYHSECFSEGHNDTSDGVLETMESLSDGVGREVVHESHEECMVTGDITSLSITDDCNTTSHDNARPLGYGEIVRKSSTNGWITEGMGSVNGCHEMPLDTESVDCGGKEAWHDKGELRSGHSKLCNNNSSKNGVEKVVHICNGDSQHLPDVEIKKLARRPFCKRCEKMQDLCICNRIKAIVQNKIKITILQNPKEKHHAVGSARVALLGLDNVSLIRVPEIFSKESFRIRPKVPGSKRSLAGRGGKKILLKGGELPVVTHDTALSDAEVLQIRNLLIEIFDRKCNHVNSLLRPKEDGEMVHQDSIHSERINGARDGFVHKLRPPEDIIKGNGLCGGHFDAGNGVCDSGSLCLHELESLIPPGVALLYPSDKAIELSELHQNLGPDNAQEVKAPCHLIVLDGTWSKARRIYHENRWLQSLPHYKLSLSSPSLYEGVRKQPKPGCLSTLESIVYALKVLEPDTEGLDSLLEVFDSMVEDQRQCKEMKCSVQKSGVD